MHNCIQCGTPLSCTRGKYPRHTINCTIKRCQKCLRGKNRDEGNPNWKNARTPNKDGYILISRNGKTTYEHRFVMEKHLGRPLKRSEQVHHIDKNRSNNALENLEIITPQEHTRMHMTGHIVTHSTREKIRQSRMGSKNPMYGKIPWNKKVAI